MHNLLFQQFFKNLILGKHAFVKSTSVYKRSILTGALSLLLILVTLTYQIFDLLMSVYISSTYYFVLMGFGVIAFLLNRNNYHNTAKTILLYSALIMVFVFGSSEPNHSGSYFNIFPLIFAAFALYGYKKKYLAIFFTVITSFVFFFMYITDYPIIDLPSLTPLEYKVNYIVHFVVSLLSTFFIINFLINLNHTTESYLRNNEQYLNKVLGELEASKQRFELAFKGSNAGLYDWDIKNNNIYHSPMWKNMLGYSDDEVENFSIEDFYNMTHPDDTDRVKSNIENLLKNKSRYNEEVRIKTKSGEYKWFIDSGIALWDENGEPIRLVGSIIDISKIKDAEEKIKIQNKMLEKTNDELDRFVYSTSHDLRAPLMSILGLIDVAKNSSNREEIEEYLDLMANRVNRLDEFIGEIIDFSRNSRLEVKREKVKLKELLDDIVNDLQFIENSNKIALKIDVQKGLEIQTDKKRIEIVMRNVVTNAFKYHNCRRKDPFVKISAHQHNGTAQILIEDNGDGISNEKQERIFDMFYRGSEKSIGSGLGLYIAKEMVEKLNGKISLKSAYGKGATFIIDLPQNHN